jgi:hypothetical protein
VYEGGKQSLNNYLYKMHINNICVLFCFGPGKSNDGCILYSSGSSLFAYFGTAVMLLVTVIQFLFSNYYYDAFLLVLVFNHEDGGYIFLRNVG